mmetsp:Transcript_33020/g.74140  ORF Transcript_33020/g.74140 Transcript_33020/m.74140 type:complete len:256 (-) Transcript_33020:22-789(-)
MQRTRRSHSRRSSRLPYLGLCRLHAEPLRRREAQPEPAGGDLAVQDSEVHRGVSEALASSQAVPDRKTVLHGEGGGCCSWAGDRQASLDLRLQGALHRRGGVVAVEIFREGGNHSQRSVKLRLHRRELPRASSSVQQVREAGAHGLGLPLQPVRGSRTRFRCGDQEVCSRQIPCHVPSLLQGGCQRQVCPSTLLLPQGHLRHEEHSLELSEVCCGQAGATCVAVSFSDRSHGDGGRDSEAFVITLLGVCLGIQFN